MRPRPALNVLLSQLCLAEKTVKNYISGLFAKLGMERRTQAAAYAARVFREPAERGEHAEAAGYR